MRTQYAQMDPGLLAQKLDFERTVSIISTRFVVPSEDFSQAIQVSLADMARVSSASRAYVFEFTEDLEHMSNTYEWCDLGVSPEIDNLQDLPTEIFPWWMAKLRNNEIILIPRVHDMPPEASAEKEILESQAIEALVVLPLYVKGRLHGYIGFDSILKGIGWTEDDLLLLRLASELFSSAFHRLEDERQLITNNQALKANIDEIRRLQSQLIQQEKMVGIGQLAAGIAHEINNPLGFVTSNYEVLYKYAERIQAILSDVRQLISLMSSTPRPSYDTSEGTASSSIESSIASSAQCYDQAQQVVSNWKTYKIDRVLEDMMDLLDDSKVGFDRVSAIIASLRNFAHTDMNNVFDYEDLHSILEEALLILSNEVKYYAQVERDFGPLPQIFCQRGQIGQVLINLIINAIHAIKKANRPGLGQLVLKTWTTDNEAGTSFAHLSITDNGIGIPPENLPQIFNPFFTTKEVGEGTGLGLSITYDIIVNKHSGTITADSQPGIGTTFTLRLPIQG